MYAHTDTLTLIHAFPYLIQVPRAVGQQLYNELEGDYANFYVMTKPTQDDAHVYVYNDRTAIIVSDTRIAGAYHVERHLQDEIAERAHTLGRIRARKRLVADATYLIQTGCIQRMIADDFTA